MIGDGYDFNGVVTGGGESIRLTYRPMLRNERKHIRSVASHIGGETGKSIVLMEAANRISYWSRSRFASMTELAELEKSNNELWTRLWMVLAGVEGASPEWSQFWEDETASNLRKGVRLLREFPMLAKRTCDECKLYWLDAKGAYTYEGKERLLRPATCKVPCECPSGCPVGHFTRQNRLSAANCKALDHYIECRAVGVFPSDAIVRRNAAIIEMELGKTGGPARTAR